MSNSPPKDKSAQSHVAFAVQILSIISIPVFLVFLYLYYFDNNPPCTYSSFELNQTEYCRGDFVDVSIAYCKKKSVPFTMYMRLANDVSINIEPITVIEGAPLGCGVYDFKTVRIPDFAPYGTYKLLGSNVYHVNFLRDRTVSWETSEFMVRDCDSNE